jgi:hypothetical protein
MTQRERAVEVLARALYQGGPVIPGQYVKTEAWERLAPAMQRQWLEAGRYLASALQHHMLLPE